MFTHNAIGFLYLSIGSITLDMYNVLQKGGKLLNIEHVGIDISCNMILALYYLNFDSTVCFYLCTVASLSEENKLF